MLLMTTRLEIKVGAVNLPVTLGVTYPECRRKGACGLQISADKGF